MEKTNRKSSFELLRIISMLLIVMSHYVAHSEILNIECNVNRIIAQFIFIGGKLGVTLFVLISGYFLVNSEFKLKKLLKIILETFFYSITIYLLFILMGKREFSLQTLINSSLPIITGQYWFMTAYVGMYILSPIINFTIKNMDKKFLKNVLLLLFFILYFIPTITTKDPFGNDVMQFIYLYMIGGYIRLYDIEFIKKQNRGLKIGGLSIAAIYLTSIAFTILGQKFSFFEKGLVYFAGQRSFLILFAGIGLFYYFSQLELQSKKINFIAKTSLGVYLIHDNRMMRYYIWKDLVNVEQYFHSSTISFLSNFMTSAIIIYCVCVVIDLLRIYILETPIFKIQKFDRIFEKVDNFMKLRKEE